MADFMWMVILLLVGAGTIRALLGAGMDKVTRDLENDASARIARDLKKAGFSGIDPDTEEPPRGNGWGIGSCDHCGRTFGDGPGFCNGHADGCHNPVCEGCCKGS